MKTHDLAKIDKFHLFISFLTWSPVVYSFVMSCIYREVPWYFIVCAVVLFYTIILTI